jgi:hypothetical protein
LAIGQRQVYFRDGITNGTFGQNDRQILQATAPGHGQNAMVAAEQALLRQAASHRSVSARAAIADTAPGQQGHHHPAVVRNCASIGTRRPPAGRK